MGSTETIEKIVDEAVASAKPPAFWRYIRVTVATDKPIICDDAFWSSFRPWINCKPGDENRNEIVVLAANRFRYLSYGDNPGESFPADGLWLDIYDYHTDTPRNQVGQPLELHRTRVKITRQRN